MTIALAVVIRVAATFLVLVAAAVAAHYLKRVIPDGRVKRILYRKFYTY